MRRLERRLTRLEGRLNAKRFDRWSKVPIEQWPDAVLEDFLRATCPDLAGAGAPLSDELLFKLIHGAEAAVQPKPPLTEFPRNPDADRTTRKLEPIG